MEIDNDKLYLKRDLQLYLKKMGLPSSYPTIIKYEKMGLIPSPRRTIAGFEHKWRLYTGEEIKDIAEILKQRNGK